MINLLKVLVGIMKIKGIMGILYQANIRIVCGIYYTTLEERLSRQKDHQRALAMDNDDDVPMETRESKPKANTDSTVKEVAAQYSETITNMSTDLNNHNIGEEDLTQDVIDINPDETHDTSTPVQGDGESVTSYKRILDQNFSPISQPSRRKLNMYPSLSSNQPSIQPITPSSPNKESELL